MPGFLDRKAPSIRAEYAHYLDSDVLGKILFKNFFLNVLNFKEDHIHSPLGRHRRYDERRISSDAQIFIGKRWVDAEIKTSHVNIVHPYRSNSLKCWSFGRILYTTRKREKIPFDFVFAVGIYSRGIADPEYWEDLGKSLIPHKKRRKDNNPEIFPDEIAFLSRCGIFLLPHKEILTNDVAVTISSIPKCPYYQFFSWGDDIEGCRRIWVEIVKGFKNKKARTNSSRGPLGSH